MVVLQNGEKREFDILKIENSVKNANSLSKNPFTSAEVEELVKYIEFVISSKKEDVSTEYIQDFVEDQIMIRGAYDVARNFDRQRNKKESDEIASIDREANSKALKNLKIRKKSGVIKNYDPMVLLESAGKSAVRAREDGLLTDKESSDLIALIESELVKKANEEFVNTSYLHMLMEKYLSVVAPDVGNAYSNYHSFRLSQAKEHEKIMGRCTDLFGDKKDEATLEEKRTNANADSTLASTQKCFCADYTAESHYEEFFLTNEERQLAKDGYIYFHDKNGRSIYPFNCCLFRMSDVLKNGFMMNNIWYNPPKSLDVAFDVIGDVSLMSASQQYGGFTIPRIDTIIAPYAELSYNAYVEKYKALGVEEENAKRQAMEDIENEMMKGFQGLEYKFNTVASSRGDYPFTTVSIGLDTSTFGKMAAKCCLKTRRGGQGEKGKKKPVLFPKIVFLFDKNLHLEGKPNYDVFEEGLKCSAKTMYPDWLSLTGEGYVPSMYKKYGAQAVVSPMGCRAFLSPYYERGGFEPADNEDKPVFEGRFNLGVISLNLPMILAKSQKEGTDFYEELDHILEIVRKNHKRTYEYISHMKASKNPVGFVYGGFYIPNGVKLSPDDEIAPALKAATMSFGVTALNELQMLYNGKSLVEDGQFAIEVMDHINQKIAEFKSEDHILYAIYGTPAEKLCHTQVIQFRSKYGIVKGVSDRAYVSNSFHCHVTENITPIQKQNLESRFWNYFNGGKIQYCKYPIGYNIESMRTLILRAMEMGFYEGVNMSLSYCDDCGYEELEMGNVCPKCGGYHITQIDRMNGYLAFTRVGSDTKVTIDEEGNKIVEIHSRYAPHKLKEIEDRVSM